jgi:hypothetical protein
VATAAVAIEQPIQGDRLSLLDPGDPLFRRGSFRALREGVEGPSFSDDPRVLGATLEVTGLGGGDGSFGPVFLPPANWVGLGDPPGRRGYHYVDPDATTGILRLVFKCGINRVKLSFRGRGPNWTYAITQPQGAIRVRFQVGDETYCAEFNDYYRNEAGRVVGLRAPKPVSCGAPLCGNGLAEGAEECDDGNTTGGDGCADGCELENTSAVCAGVPSVAGTALESIFVAKVASPVGIAAPPLDPHRLFILEQPGRVRVVAYGNLLSEPFLDIRDIVNSGGERGLLGIAFHPDYENNGRFFLNYTNLAGDTVIARYQVSANPNVADPASAHILLVINQPFANHNGGQLAFGPDGYLYVGMGDGGSQGDPNDNGQDEDTLLGKLLRIDVDVEDPPYYAVPPSNPRAVYGDPLGLMWAKGLRNPWRFSFDRLTGDLYIADVGAAHREEVSFQPAGITDFRNYGWDVFEGTNCAEPKPHFPSCPDPPTGFVMPIVEYTHASGCSVTGGYVYRGCRMPDLHGTYFYSDYCAAFIRTVRVVGGVATDPQNRTAEIQPDCGRAVSFVTSFGEDARGEMYIADHQGSIRRIVPAQP